MVSVASGWFFLIVCEMFPVGSRNFRLPGLGSYLQTAASNGDTQAMIWGIITMLLIIVVTDQLLWRPLIAWSDKFKFESVESVERVTSPVLHILRNSMWLWTFSSAAPSRPSARICTSAWPCAGASRASQAVPPHARRSTQRDHGFERLAAFAASSSPPSTPRCCCGTSTRISCSEFLRARAQPSARECFAAARLALDHSVGVAIGFHPKLAHLTQPLAQIAASFPATALFPVILLGLMSIGVGIGIGSIALMMLGTQWYILFNVIAGAMAIPSDLKEVSDLFRFNSVQRWTTVILPGIFPYLITGWSRLREARGTPRLWRSISRSRTRR